MNKYRLLKITKWFISTVTDATMCNTIMEDLEYRFAQAKNEKGCLFATIYLLFQSLIIIQPFVIENFIGGFTMFKSYLKIAFRNVKKHKGFSLINITGLAIGICLFILIMLFVQNEFSYDKFNKNSNVEQICSE